MQVVILAGGFGTRIRDVTEDIPKPMIPIGSMPIIWHIMKYYGCFGHKHFVLCLGYKGNVIRDFFLNYDLYTSDVTVSLGEGQNRTIHRNHNEFDWKVTLADTGLHSMTGARVRRIRDHINGDDFMLTYGDGVGDIDLHELLKFHRSHGKVLTVSGVRPPGRFGEMLHDGGRVTEFNEKPQASSGLISGGFFVANRKLFDYLDGGDDLVFEKDPMKTLVSEGNLMVYEHDGFWQPMDTSREYQSLNAMYSSGVAPWVRW